MTQENKVEPKAKLKGLLGNVVSTATTKTAVVEVERLKMHPLYKKLMRRHKRYMAHDEDSTCGVGDVVEIVPCRPVSRRKRWQVLRVVQKAE